MGNNTKRFGLDPHKTLSSIFIDSENGPIEFFTTSIHNARECVPSKERKIPSKERLLRFVETLKFAPRLDDNGQELKVPDNLKNR